MHRDAGPWTWIHIPVMEGVNIFIELFDMNEAMDPVEMELAPQREQAQPKHAVDGMFLPGDIGNPVVGS